MNANQAAEVAIVVFCALLLLGYNLHYFLMGGILLRRHASLWDVGVDARKEWALRMMAGEVPSSREGFGRG